MDLPAAYSFTGASRQAAFFLLEVSLQKV